MNIPAGIEVIVLGNVTVESFLQPSNMFCPILVIFSVIANDVKPVFLKHNSSNDVTDAGIFSLDNDWQSSKKPYGILSNVVGNEMFFRLVHPLNAIRPIEVTLSGMLMLSKLVQSLKAPSPIDLI
ncbi:MAG: hypothetical protein NC248_06775 [Bacteroides sp.]|nr:hypothetical protein [Bacteroides sp.]MCM1390526.1 hypothetical protein [Bacteroides sp.]